MSLQNKVAIVTGGNSGIGQAIVLELARQGAAVVIDYVVHPEATEALEREVGKLGARSVGVEADISAAGIRGQATGTYALRPVFLVGDFDDYRGTVKATQEIDYLGTLRGRLGYGGNGWLLYATGGLAWAHVKASLDSTHVRLTNSFPFAGFPAALDGHAAADGFNIGYAAGAGGGIPSQCIWLEVRSLGGTPDVEGYVILHANNSTVITATSEPRLDAAVKRFIDASRSRNGRREAPFGLMTSFELAR